MQKFKTLMVSAFDISFDNITSSFTITNSAQNFQLLGTSTCDYIVGFSGTQNASLSGGKYKLTLPRPCNFLPLPRICIRCTDLASENFVVGKGGTSTSDLILTVPNNSKQNSQIVYMSDIVQLFTKDAVHKLTFRITDEQNNLINFNGISLYFSIKFDIYRKKPVRPPTFNVLKTLGNLNLSPTPDA
jgi:hypothetical protein